MDPFERPCYRSGTYFITRQFPGAAEAQVFASNVATRGVNGYNIC